MRPQEAREPHEFLQRSPLYSRRGKDEALLPLSEPLKPLPLQGLTFLEVHFQDGFPRKPLWCFPSGEVMEGTRDARSLGEALRADGFIPLVNELGLYSRGGEGALYLVAPQREILSEEAFSGPLSLPEAWEKGALKDTHFFNDLSSGKTKTLIQRKGASEAFQGEIPAYLRWDSEGALVSEAWRAKGFFCSPSGPAYLTRTPEGAMAATWAFKDASKKLFWDAKEERTSYLTGTLPLAEASRVILELLGFAHEEFASEGLCGEEEGLWGGELPPRLERIFPQALELFFLEQYLTTPEYQGLPYSWWAPQALNEAKRHLQAAWEASPLSQGPSKRK